MNVKNSRSGKNLGDPMRTRVRNWLPAGICRSVDERATLLPRYRVHQLIALMVPVVCESMVRDVQPTRRKGEENGEDARAVEHDFSVRHDVLLGMRPEKV